MLLGDDEEACCGAGEAAQRWGPTLYAAANGLAAIARRLYPQAETPSAAFHALVSDRLLPWLLQLERTEKPRRHEPAGLLNVG